MAKLLLALFLVFLAWFAGETAARKDSCDYLATAGVGCPHDENACRQLCQPCFTGTGRIEAKCNRISELPIWQCRCYFLDGAPCPPPVGTPRCPGSPFSSATNNTTSGVDAFTRPKFPLFLAAVSLITLLSVF